MHDKFLSQGSTENTEQNSSNNTGNRQQKQPENWASVDQGYLCSNLLWADSEEEKYQDVYCVLTEDDILSFSS